MDKALKFTPVKFVPEVVRKVVPKGKIGTYILGIDQNGFLAGYIGRSDNCLRARLCMHNHLWEFEYFIVKYAKTVSEAYHEECSLFHYHQQIGMTLINVIHPASPGGSGLVCPHCEFKREMQQLGL